MKNKKKVFGFIVILLVLSLVTIGIMRGKIFTRKDNKDCITRKEWIAMLGEYMGVKSYSSENPYFDDVDKNDKYYSYIQSSVEWGLVENNREFKGNDFATGEFIAVSAIKSVGEPKLQLFLKKKKKLNEKDYLDIAVEYELITKGQLSDGLSTEEAGKVIKRLDKLYYEVFWPDDVEEYKLQDSVIELKKESVLSYDKESEVMKCKEELKVGNIVKFKKGRAVVARKISKILSDGTYELEYPEMEEVFETLTESGVSELTLTDILNYYGKDSLKIVDSGSEKSNSIVTVSHTISGNAETDGFKIEAEEDSGKLKICVTDNDTGVKYELPVHPKISKDYNNFSASLDISKIFVGAQIDYSALSGVKYADVAVDIQSEVKAGLSTEDEISDRIILFETPAPIGNGLVGVDIQIYLVTTLKGEIYLEADIPFQTEIYYEKDKGVRNIKHDISVKDPKVEATAELKEKIDIVPILVVCEFEPVIDAELGVGVSTTASVTVRDNNQICADVETKFPVVDISVGEDDVLYYGRETLIAKLGLSASWEDIFKDEDFIKKIKLHYEVLPDKTKQFVKKCTYKGEATEKTEDEVLNELLKGDFSRFAGSYKVRDIDIEGKNIEDLVLNKDGSISGGGTGAYKDLFPTSKLESVKKYVDGSYLCVLKDEYDGTINEYFIYPEGIVEEEKKTDTFLRDTVYISMPYINSSGDNSAFNRVYYKEMVNEDDLSSGGLNNVYTTKDNNVPIFRINYSDNWKVEQEDMEEDHEWDILSNDRGVEINIYSMESGFESQYSGGGYIMQYAHCTKVEDSALVVETYNGKEDSWLGKFVVAKIKVYAYENCESEDVGGEVECDGPTYYALVPESYLGEVLFKLTKCLEACSWQYGSGREVSIIAEAPEGGFTPEEEEEVIRILSTFKQN